jgi:hypothetical protein
MSCSGGRRRCPPTANSRFIAVCSAARNRSSSAGTPTSPAAPGAWAQPGGRRDRLSGHRLGGRAAPTGAGDGAGAIGIGVGPDRHPTPADHVDRFGDRSISRRRSAASRCRAPANGRGLAASIVSRPATTGAVRKVDRASARRLGRAGRWDVELRQAGTAAGVAGMAANGRSPRMSSTKAVSSRDRLDEGRKPSRHMFSIVCRNSTGRIRWSRRPVARTGDIRWIKRRAMHE